MSQSVPNVQATTSAAPAAAEITAAAKPKIDKAAASKMPKDDWVKLAAEEIGEIGDSSDDDDTGEASKPSKGEKSKTKQEKAPERGKDGKFLPADGDKEDKPAKKEDEPKVETKKEDKKDEPEPKKDEPKDKAKDPEVAKFEEEKIRFSEAVREERIKQQQAWTQIHREAAKIRQREESIKSVKADLERLKTLETRLKTDGERYRVIEEMGGSLGDWQKRAVSGEGPSPQLEDVKKFFAEKLDEVKKDYQTKLDEVRAAQKKRDEEEEAYAQHSKVRSAESAFDNALLEESSKYEHTKALGPQAVDKAHDFAEYVARALKGRRDIPRSELPWVKEYLEKVPQAVALDPGQIVGYIAGRLAREASVWGGSPKPQPTERETVRATEESSKTEQRGRTTQALDNSASGTRATPRAPQEMTRAEFDEWAAAHIGENDDE